MESIKHVPKPSWRQYYICPHKTNTMGLLMELSSDIYEMDIDGAIFGPPKSEEVLSLTIHMSFSY